MGNCLFYLDRDKDLGDISKRRWRVLRQLLVVFVDYVNEVMRDPEAAGDYRSVAVREGGAALHPSLLQVGAPTASAAFKVNDLLEDRSEETDEIFFLDAEELRRLFAWADFLKDRDGAFELFAPLIATLREKTSRIAEYAGDPQQEALASAHSRKDVRRT
ncbi:MAG: hypothetical protein R3F14_22170 [Polyangiaceae bacterium]